MTDRPGVDPRFDPMFQRGYSGAVEPGAATTPRPTQTPSAEPQARPVEARVASSDPVVTTEFAGDPGDEPAPSRPNPFIVLLWLLGPVLSVGGAVTTYQALTESFSGRSQGDPVMQQLLWVLAPSAVTVGLAIIAGLLFWHAAAFRRSRS